MEHFAAPHIDEEMQRCIDLCEQCHRTCLETVAQYSLEQGGVHALPDQVRLMFDCSEMCQTAANFMLRGSQLFGYVCGLCSHICKVCADRCMTMSADEHMRSCAELCSRCADECLRMSKVAAGTEVLT